MIYEAFNSAGVSVVISDADLDKAAHHGGPLSAELADAAGAARRTDMAGQLRRSLDGAERARKLAAAKALLALDDRDAGPLLESLAASEADTVVAKSFTAVATRLRGSRAALEVFEDPGTDPQLARLLLSNYNSHLRPNGDDIRFLVAALRHYLTRGLPWLTRLRPDLWDNGVFLIVNALSNDRAVRLLRDDVAARSGLLRLLTVLPEHTDDDDIASGATDLRAALSD
ncbi:hypothetical protein A5724_04245 [Mycobacterium sp. ACS1612]|uniref:hypothetical protein n=1 Tax=Mycobacterium sp. ACS1612 TaxID=1834117 RepID=UPI000801C3EA|nr:hypothetical protein [Mycobacterium sp. ACS1612]OBF25602.1 hypothetical protein A5724_04245 [Mycobacterium sp. ACS1612]